MKIKILMGQICSGMTAYSHQLALNQGYIRISIEDIKKMMWPHCSYLKGKRIDDIVSAIIERIIETIDSVSTESRIVIDGFPMEHSALKYLISIHDVDIIIFTTSLLRANINNRKRLKPVDPEEIRKYNNEFLRWIKLSSEFLLISQLCTISYMENYEKQKLNLVM